MPSYDPTLFNVSPYYDDFDEDKNFHRLLFKPGYAVQARELTQVQTVLQNQIERFGNHIFKEGSRVFGSEIVANDISFLRMIPYVGTPNGATQGINLDNWIGNVIHQGSSDTPSSITKAKVVHAEKPHSDNDNYSVFFLDYLQGSSFNSGATVYVESSAGGTAWVAGASGDVISAPIGGEGSSAAGDAVNVDGITGKAKLVSVTPGIYYVNGSFVKNPSQTLSPFALTGDNDATDVRYFPAPSSKIGFDIKQSIVDAHDDFSLRDPSAGSYNYNAPGADRYKIELDLVHTQAGIVDGIETTYKNIIELLRFREGKITYKNVYTQYNELEKTLARRTYDESGNYTVKPFNMHLIEHLDDGTNNGAYTSGKKSAAGIAASEDYLACGLEPGKAYIFGHEFETQATEFVDIRKARGEDHIKTLDLYKPNSADYGLWIYVTARNLEDFGILLCSDSGGRNIHNDWTKYLLLWDGSSADNIQGDPIFDGAEDAGIGVKSSWVGRAWPANIEKAKYTIATDSFAVGSPVKINSAGDADTNGDQVYKLYMIALGRRRPSDPLPDGSRFHKYVEYATRLTTKSTYWDLSNHPDDYKDEVIDGYTKNSDGTITNADHLVANILKGRAEWGAPRNNRVYQYTPNNYGNVFWSDKGSAVGEVTHLEYKFPWSWDVADGDSGFTVATASDNGQIKFEISSNWPNGNGCSYNFTNSASGVQLTSGERADIILLKKNNNTTENPETIDNLELDWNISTDGTGRTLIFRPNDPADEITAGQRYTLSAPVQVVDTNVDSETGSIATMEYKSKVVTKRMYYDDASPTVHWHVRKGWGDDTVRIYSNTPMIHHCSKIIMNDKGITTDVTSEFSLHDGTNRMAYWGGWFEAHSGTTMASIMKDTQLQATGYGGIAGATWPDLEFHLDYFERTNPQGNRPGPIVVNSYINGGVTMDLIPMEQLSGTRRTLPVNLSSCVDFRFGHPSLTGNADRVMEVGCNIISGSLKMAHNYYLPRVDKVILTNQLGSQNSTFQVLEGRPSEVPLPPTDRSDSLTLYSMIVPPYTYNSGDVIVNQTNHQRYTMRDIGRLDKKITDVEHYASISLLEKEMMAKQMYRGDNEYEMFKAGIFVDQFRGHDKADCSRWDYTCSIDKENNILRPPFEFRNYTIGVSADINSNLTKTDDDLILLKSTTEKLIEQPRATTSISINPFNLVNWLGNLTISPPSSRQFDMGKRPVVKTYSGGLNDNWRSNNWGGKGGLHSFVNRVMKGFGTQWNDWESIWCGVDLGDNEFYNERGKMLINRASTKLFDVQVDSMWWDRTGPQAPRVTQTIDQTKSEVGMKARQNPEQLTQEINNRIVDNSVVPYLKEETLTISVNSLKPNTEVNCFFDDRDVNEYCSILNSNGDKQFGPFKTGTDGSIINDNDDEVDITFTIPSNVFLTGEKLFRVTDNADNEVSQSSTAAEEIYYATGTQPLNSEAGVNSTRPPIIQRQSITSNKVVRDISTRKQTMDTSVNTQWVDPIAQTFTVDVNDYRDGLFLESVDLFFAGKDDYDPVTIELRPLLNGRPHGSHTIPFSRKTLDVNDVNVDINSPSVATKFSFSSPVYLAPGDYALVIKCNSVDAQIWAAEIGSTDIITGEMIDRQPYSGVLFQPQNSSVAEVNQGLDLMFTLHKSVFSSSANESNSTAVLDISNSSYGSSGLDASVIRMNSNQLLPMSTKLRHKMKWTVDDAQVVHANENIEVSSKGYSDSDPQTISYRILDGTQQITTVFSGTSHVSPVIDLKNLDLFGIRNVVNNVARTEPQRYAWGLTTQKAAARYISRRVDLSSGIEANHLRVFLDVNQEEDRSIMGNDITDYANQTNSGIEVWVKWMENDAAGESDETDNTNTDSDMSDTDSVSTLNTEDAMQKSFDFLRWYKMDAINDPFISGPSQSDFDYREIEYRLPWYLGEGLNVNSGDLIGTFAVKIVMFAKDSTKPPKVKNLRVIALTG